MFSSIMLYVCYVLNICMYVCTSQTQLAKSSFSLSISQQSAIRCCTIAVSFVVHIDHIAWGWSLLLDDQSIVVCLTYGHRVWPLEPFSHCNDYGWHVLFYHDASGVELNYWSFAKNQLPEECRMADPVSFSTVLSMLAAAPTVGLL
jgi:hypothetical protein